MKANQLTADEIRCNNHECKLRETCMRYKQLVIDHHARKCIDYEVHKFEGFEHDEFGFVTKCISYKKIENERIPNF